MEPNKPQTSIQGIKGWGADLDHKNRPAYPKERYPARPIGVHWTHPVQQFQSVEILKSNERPMMTPIFGSSTPPKGLSGMFRRIAFKFSENDLRHWLILLFADRINVVEGVIEDIGNGRFPNIFAEMGWKAKLKHDRVDLVKKVVITSLLVGGVIYIMKARKRRQY